MEYEILLLFMQLVSRHNVNRTKIVQKNHSLQILILQFFCCFSSVTFDLCSSSAGVPKMGTIWGR